MRNIIVHCDNDKSVGCDAYMPVQVEDNATDKEIDALAFDVACEHASSYWDIVDPWQYVEEDSEDEVPDDSDIIYLDQITATWLDYEPEMHDELRTGGGSFADDFAAMERDDIPF